MMTTAPTPDLTDYDPERAARMAAWLSAQDTHRADQKQADKRRRAEKQADFDERGLPRGTWVL